MSVIRVIDEAERTPSRRSILIMLAVLCLGQAPYLRAQSVDDLAQRLAHNRLEANELALDQRAGDISQQDYTDRALKNQQEFTRLEQVLRGLSPNAHAEVRSKATVIYNQGTAKLQAKQAQIQAAENQANIEARQQLLRQRAAAAPTTQPSIPSVPPIPSRMCRRYKSSNLSHRKSPQEREQQFRRLSPTLRWSGCIVEPTVN